jgi:hypothetical protein
VNILMRLHVCTWGANGGACVCVCVCMCVCVCVCVSGAVKELAVLAAAQPLGNPADPG